MWPICGNSHSKKLFEKVSWCTVIGHHLLMQCGGRELRTLSSLPEQEIIKQKSWRVTDTELVLIEIIKLQISSYINWMRQLTSIQWTHKCLGDAARNWTTPVIIHVTVWLARQGTTSARFFSWLRARFIENSEPLRVRRYAVLEYVFRKLSFFPSHHSQKNISVTYYVVGETSRDFRSITFCWKLKNRKAN